MKKLSTVIIVSVMLGLLIMSFALTAPTTASGADPAAFYKGKVVKFIVPYRAGGGYDAYARLIARYLQKELDCTVIVRNMPGGMTYIALNHVYRAKPNGLVMVIADAKVASLNQLVGDPKAKGLDVRKFNWLCRVAGEQSVMTMGKKSGFKTLKDLMESKRTIKFGGTAKGSSNHISASTLIEALGLNGTIIMGFSGSSALALATMRGELDGFGGSSSSAADYSKQPDLFALVHVAPERSDVLPNVPTVAEAVRLSPEGAKWIERLSKIVLTGRSVTTTPGVPKARLQFLRNALRKTMHGKEFLATAKKMERPIQYLSGEEVAEVVNWVLNMPKSEAKQVEHVMLEKYTKK